MSGAAKNGDKTPNARAVGVPAVKIIDKGQLLAIRGALTLPAGGEPISIPSFGPSDGYYVSVQLRPLRRAEVWRNGRHVATVNAPSAGVHIFDMRERWRALIYSSFQSVTFSLPRTVFAGEDDGTARTALPEIDIGLIDPTLRHLAMALTPAFARPSEVSQLFAEHVLEAVGQHLRRAYGEISFSELQPTGGLAPWQKRRASDMMRAALDGEISNADLARECGLSPGHFAKAFRQSFGLPPHRWLMRERVRRAMDIMTGTALPLDEIALACGFFDQAHLTRVFRVMVGHTPAAWRRDRGRGGSGDANGRGIVGEGGGLGVGPRVKPEGDGLGVGGAAG
ncbi:helix-turn-helix domain-containing protein [Pelagibacterium luteolum]|uniref:AraC-type DNA-binding protein n=1 Tax=Pelagibacterium luteolum TaxID=440168 RepID=A0A1G7TCK8_9HYPH|nr:AraC family transcriptional regulator [Pelagibacterium luteolum]SDG32832.1 AraC-type DNA-binding protein [Pelagibacterium luteolum]